MTEEVKNDLNRRINAALDKIRPYLEADGGDITLEEVTEDFTVKVKLNVLWCIVSGDLYGKYIPGITLW